MGESSPTIGPLEAVAIEVGLIEYATDTDALDLLGREFLVETLRERHDETGAKIYEPAESLLASEEEGE